MNEQLYELDVNQHDGLMGAIDSVGIDLTDKQRGDIFDAVRRFLVPVEPDYEAAQAVRDKAGYWARTKDIVDAALGLDDE